MVENRVLACYTSVTRGCFALSTFTTVPTLCTEHLVQIICVALDIQLCGWWNSWFVLEIMDCSSVKQEKLYLNALLPSAPSSLNLQFIYLVVEEHCISSKAGSGSIQVCTKKKKKITLSSENRCSSVCFFFSLFFKLKDMLDRIRDTLWWFQWAAITSGSMLWHSKGLYLCRGAIKSGVSSTDLCLKYLWNPRSECDINTKLKETANNNNVSFCKATKNLTRLHSKHKK